MCLLMVLLRQFVSTIEFERALQVEESIPAAAPVRVLSSAPCPHHHHALINRCLAIPFSCGCRALITAHQSQVAIVPHICKHPQLTLASVSNPSKQP